jgi:hypothetical protein
VTSFDQRDSAPFMPKCVVVDPNFDWKVGLLELAKQLGNSLPPRRRGSAKPAK